jgi:hypothetical protein
MKYLYAIIAFAVLLCSDLQATVYITPEAARTSDAVFRIRDAYKNFFLTYRYYPPANTSLALRILQGEFIRGFNWNKIVFWIPHKPVTKWFFWTIPGDLDAHGNAIDGWGHPFHFTVTDEGLVIWSAGADGSDSLSHAVKSMRGTVLVPTKYAEQGAAANP